MKLDPKIVAGLSQVPNFSYTPVTAGQAANVVGYTPQGYTATGYKPALMPEGKALWNTMPAYQMASPGEKKIFDAAIRQFNANAGNQIKQITDFAKAVQKLPSLAGPALAIARGEISPQANAAAAAATRTANFMRLLGATGADIQRGVAANIGSSYTNAAQTLQALAGAVGGTVGGTMQASMNATPQSGMAPGVPTGGLTGVPGGAAAGLTNIQGTLPAQGLTAQAGPATAADSSLASILMGGAAQQAKMALAQGNQNVAALWAKLPEYQQAALQQLTTERNANLDRQLQLMQMSGQISASQREAIMSQASAEAGAWGTDVSGMNARNLAGWQAGIDALSANVGARNTAAAFGATAANTAAAFTATAGNEAAAQRASAINAANAAQASRDLQAQIANSQMALTSASDKAAYQQRRLANYFSYMRTVYAANKTAAGKPPDFVKMAAGLNDAASGVYGKPYTIKDANGQDVVVQALQKPKTPVNKAWLNYRTAYMPAYVRQFGKNALTVMFNTFKGYYPGIPDSWTASNIEKNWGPISTASDGQGGTYVKSGHYYMPPAPGLIRADTRQPYVIQG